MSRAVVRHALSEANNRENFGKPAFGHPDAPLMPEGRVMAQNMGSEFTVVYGIVPVNTPVAVSRMLRSQETAREAGFVDLQQYSILNEVDMEVPYAEIKQSIADRRLSSAALEAAKVILSDPPEEQVWVTHGLVIAGLCEVLGIASEFERFVPKYCEIRELPI